MGALHKTCNMNTHKSDGTKNSPQTTSKMVVHRKQPRPVAFQEVQYKSQIVFSSSIFFSGPAFKVNLSLSVNNENNELQNEKEVTLCIVHHQTVLHGH